MTSTANALTTDKIDEIADFIEAYARDHKWRGVRASRTEHYFDGEYVKIPVAMRLRNAWDKANRLQEIEDSWNNRAARRFPRLVIIPAEAPLDT